MLSVYLGAGVWEGLDRGIIKGPEKTGNVSMFIIFIVVMVPRVLCCVWCHGYIYICQDLTKGI